MKSARKSCSISAYECHGSVAITGHLNKEATNASRANSSWHGLFRPDIMAACPSRWAGCRTHFPDVQFDLAFSLSFIIRRSPSATVSSSYLFTSSVGFFQIYAPKLSLFHGHQKISITPKNDKTRCSSKPRKRQRQSLISCTVFATFIVRCRPAEVPAVMFRLKQAQLFEAASGPCPIAPTRATPTTPRLSTVKGLFSEPGCNGVRPA